ncbi:unnamed protein product [Rhizophagus irregularis]|uniref:Uncharacterized protein n=1 Tax=Rhizophagus irregularis TaxID=588596 RepID=A0A2I1HEF0_9GLOM|nr:hypothetical protein RhiirA4_478238 [Rhizophagus irregularis]CAB4443713.1 unnamed protein product [Rhizophagus irregularis]
MSLTSINNTTENYKKILNAFFTMLLLALFTHLLTKELQLFNSNSVSYLINTDCTHNLLVAILKEYNNETPEQYFNEYGIQFHDNFGEISLHDLPSIDFESNQNLEDLDLAVYPQSLPLNSDKIILGRILLWAILY